MAKKTTYRKTTITRAKNNAKKAQAAKRKPRPREDFSQAAARIVKEATENR